MSALAHFAAVLRGPLRHLAVALALASSLACAGPARAQEIVVERRGGAPPIAGRLRSADEDALRLVTESGAEYALRWDVVRTVTPSTETLERLLGPAESLWRARTRIERDDTELAEPILAELFEVYRGRTSETALVVTEGLLRCRVARGDAVGAIIPALEAARLRALGVATDAFASMPPALDPTTLLCPQAPPVLPQGPALERLQHELETWQPSEPSVAAMADLYRHAVEVAADGALEVHEDLPPLPAAAANAPSAGSGVGWAGVRLLRQLLAAAAGDAPSAANLRRLVGGGDWRAAWASFFIGAAAMPSSEPRA
ncbi:MAG: hypothetical protein KDA22_10335, partial [Phycisphaerales bacterium]|nr:hypothetical protein [Phycisphaerales bacterium]